MQNYMVLWSVLLPNCEILFRTIPGFRLQSVWLAKLWTILRTASLSDLAPSSLLSVMDSLLISLHLPNTVILQRYVLHSYSICTSVTWPYYYRSTHFLVNLLLFLAVKCETKILPIRFAALSTYCVILSTDCPSVKWWSTNCVCLSTSASMAWPHCTLWRCANQFPMSLVVAVYVPQPTVIWLSRRTKASTYGPHSFSVSGPTSWNSLPQSFRDATPTLGQFQRRLKTSLFHGRDLTAHTWLSGLLEQRSIYVQTEMNLLFRCHVIRWRGQNLEVREMKPHSSKWVLVAFAFVCHSVQRHRWVQELRYKKVRGGNNNNNNNNNTKFIKCHNAVRHRLRNDLYCVRWGVKLYSLTPVRRLQRCWQNR